MKSLSKLKLNQIISEIEIIDPFDPTFPVKYL
jgi:hypothetical protein